MSCFLRFTVPFETGCKGKDFFLISKKIRSFFRLFFRVSQTLSDALQTIPIGISVSFSHRSESEYLKNLFGLATVCFSIAGAKIRHLFSNFQISFPLFLHFFSSLSPTLLLSLRCTLHFFRFFSPPHHSTLLALPSASNLAQFSHELNDCS